MQTLIEAVNKSIPFCLIMVTVLSGCAGSPRDGLTERHPSYADRIIVDLTPAIEDLYLRWHELDRVHKDIKFLERGLLFNPDDRQLGYLQKINLYIQDASVRIHHQWDRLSVIGYIRPDMMRDYVTLTVESLTSAADEIGYDVLFLDIYSSHVNNRAVAIEIEKAMKVIEANVGALNRILDKLRPLANVITQPVAWQPDGG